MDNGKAFDKAMQEAIDQMKTAREAIYRELDALCAEYPYISLSRNEVGHGTKTSKNDRRMYFWITAHGPDEQEYLLDLFYSEIDPYSGNCHCQLGRIMFVKGLIRNRSEVTSPNEVLEKGPQGQLTIVFHCEKWYDPLIYINMDKEKLPREKCCNGSWLSVDDVNDNKAIPKLVAKAFIDFILEQSEGKSQEYPDHHQRAPETAFPGPFA